MRFTHPLDNILNLQKALERSMHSEWFGNGTGQRGGHPPINVFQDQDNFIVTTEIPGIKKEDIDIEIHKKRLRIRGQKKLSYPEGASIHRRERKAGSFDRTITLPFEADIDAVKAQYQHGVLSLNVPRAESEKPRSINIV